MEEQGQLEPISLEYSTETGDWDFIDGEGRVWSALFLDAETMPGEVYHDLPPEVKLRMKAAANAGKQPIDSSDIAVFSHELFEQGEFNTKKFRRLVGRSPSTLRRYFTFAEMDPQIREYVSQHRDEGVFSRAIQIGREVEDPEQQREVFFSIFGKKSKGKKDSRTLFNRKLKARLEDLTGKEFELRNHQEEPKPGKKTLGNLFDNVRRARKYVDAFCLFMERFPDIREDLSGYAFKEGTTPMPEYISLLQEQFERSFLYMGESVAEEIERFIESPKERTFRDKARDQLKRRRKREGIRIPSIGRKIEYVLTEEIGDAVQHPRNYTLKDQADPSVSDESLDIEIEETGQIKPGLIERLEDGSLRLVYGQRRLNSVRNVGIPYFKTFVVDELEDVQRGVLQCTENLFEADTAAERAKVLYTQYQLMKMLAEQKGEEYTVKDFVGNFGHLASDRTLARSIRFMEQDGIIQELVRSRIVSFGASFKISSVPEEQRFEILYSAMVLSNKELEQRIREINGNDDQIPLFDNESPRSYVRIFRQFERNSISPFAYLENAMESGEEEVAKTISSNSYLFMHYAKLYRSVCQLEEILAGD